MTAAAQSTRPCPAEEAARELLEPAGGAVERQHPAGGEPVVQGGDGQRTDERRGADEGRHGEHQAEDDPVRTPGDAGDHGPRKAGPWQRLVARAATSSSSSTLRSLDSLTRPGEYDPAFTFSQPTRHGYAGPATGRSKMADADTSGVKRPAGAPSEAPRPASACTAQCRTRSTPRRRKILAAARKILVERGYQGLTLQAIAAEAQVNKAGGLVLLRRQAAARARGARGRLRARVPPLRHHAAGRRHARHPGRPHHRERPADQGQGPAVPGVLRAPAGGRARRRAARATSGPTTRRWYEWAQAVLAPAVEQADGDTARDAALGQFAAILLDGIIVQMIVAAPEFDLEAALAHARRSLLLVAESPL